MNKQKIDLSYIGVNYLTLELSRCNSLDEMKDVIYTYISTDIANAIGYLNKYKNDYEIDLSELKKELNNILTLLGVNYAQTK